MVRFVLRLTSKAEESLVMTVQVDHSYLLLALILGQYYLSCRSRSIRGFFIPNLFDEWLWSTLLISFNFLSRLVLGWSVLGFSIEVVLEGGGRIAY